MGRVRPATRQCALAGAAVLAIRGVGAFVPPSQIHLVQGRASATRHGGLRRPATWQGARGCTSLRMLGEEMGKGGGGAPPVPLPTRPRSIEAERLSLEAEKLQLQAEKLRLEAERSKLLLDEERLQRRGVVQQKQDKVVATFREALAGGGAEGLAAAVRRQLSKVDAALVMRLADLAELEEAAEERERLWSLSEEIMRVVRNEDAALAERLNEAVREKMRKGLGGAGNAATSGGAAAAADAPPSQRELVERWVKSNYGATNANTSSSSENGGMPLPPPPLPVFDLAQLANGSVFTGGAGMPGGVVVLPLWVPTALLRHVSTAPPLQEEDVDRVKEVFGMETFYVTGVEKSPFAALFRGNLRGDSDAMFDQINARLDSAPDDLGKRVQLFLMKDPSPIAPDQTDREEARPVFILISREAAQTQQANTLAYVFGVGAFAATCFTSFAYSIGTFALNAEFFQKITEGDVAVAGKALPVAAGLVLLQLLHELGHIIAAKQNGQKLGPPVFIPSLQVGTFGAITPFLGFPKSRKAMFDVATAGPLLAIIASVASLAAGLVMTGMAPQEALGAFPVVPAALFHSSMLIGSIMSAALPSVMAQALSTPIPIHPLVIIGITGIIVNALNLMPIGRLDGGRAATAVFGRRTAAVVGTVTLLLQAVSSLFNNYSLQLFWGLVVLLFQRVQDIPAQDEVTGVDEKRTTLMLVLALFSILALLPFPTLG